MRDSKLFNIKVEKDIPLIEDVRADEFVIYGPTEDYVLGFLDGIIQTLSKKYEEVFHFSRTDGKPIKEQNEEVCYYIYTAFLYRDSTGTLKSLEGPHGFHRS